MHKKTNSLFVLSITLLIFGTGCSKSSQYQAQEMSSHPKSLSVEQKSDALQSLNNETNEEARRKNILKSMITPLDKTDAATILKLHSEKEISNEEFRALFWNTSVSKELLAELKSSLAQDLHLSELDKALIQSISDQTISFDQLLDVLKKDLKGSMPASFQTSLMDEFVRLYLRDFDLINSDNIRLFDRLALIQDAGIDPFLKQLKSILELNFYKKLLESKRLVGSRNTNGNAHREIKTNFNLDYSYNIGRCGNYTNSIRNFINVENNLGLQCNTETPSVANLDIHSTISESFGTTNIDLLMNTFVRGGYDRGHSENATTILNYNLSGKVIIPKCSNPSFCNQIITVTVSDFGRIYQGSSLTNEGLAITINGTPFANQSGNQMAIDISKQDAVIELSIAGGKKHVGACCYNTASFHKINLSIGGGNAIEFPRLEREVFNKFSTFQRPGYFGYQMFEGNLNTPDQGILFLERLTLETLKDKETFDNYRHLLYSNLELNQLNLDALMLSSNNPISILHFRQMQSAISDRIGRTIILPVITSKLLAYENAQILNLQQNINEMIKSILLINLNTESSSEEIKKIISSRLTNMNSATKDLTLVLLNSLQQNVADQRALLQEISRFQAEVALVSKKVTLEIQVLNLEKAQFEDTGFQLSNRLGNQ